MVIPRFEYDVSKLAEKWSEWATCRTNASVISTALCTAVAYKVQPMQSGRPHTHGLILGRKLVPSALITAEAAPIVPATAFELLIILINSLKRPTIKSNLRRYVFGLFYSGRQWQVVGLGQNQTHDSDDDVDHCENDERHFGAQCPSLNNNNPTLIQQFYFMYY